MSAQKQAAAGGRGGFTLLELLIAMSLLGLIFAALTGGLRFGTTAWQRASVSLSQSEDMRLTYQTLRRQLSTSVPLPDSPPQGQDIGSFSGRRDRVSFIGPAPARAMAPGLFRLTLALEPDAGTQALTLRWQRLGETVSGKESNSMEPVLRGVRSLEFGYYGQIGSGLEPTWANEWRDNEQSPNLIRISIGFADQARPVWPTMIIPILTPEGSR